MEAKTNQLYEDYDKAHIIEHPRTFKTFSNLWLRQSPVAYRLWYWPATSWYNNSIHGYCQACCLYIDKET